MEGKPQVPNAGQQQCSQQGLQNNQSDIQLSLRMGQSHAKSPRLCFLSVETMKWSQLAKSHILKSSNKSKLKNREVDVPGNHSLAGFLQKGAL